MLPKDFNVRVQAWLTNVIAINLMGITAQWIAWETADPVMSLLVTLAASIPASIAASLIILVILRGNKLADYIAKLAEDEQSPYAGVVMKTDAAAEEFDARKVVGPSEVKTL